MRVKFTDKHRKYLDSIRKDCSSTEAHRRLNRRFRTTFTLRQIRNQIDNLRTPDEPKQPRLTTAEINFLKENIEGTPIKELTVMLNAAFDKHYTATQVHGMCYWRGLRTGRDTKFKAGKKETLRTREIGTETVDSNGYVRLKVGPNDWRMKHRYVWEQANGPIPDDYVVLFLDQNKLNCALENLFLVQRKYIPIVNRNLKFSSDSVANRCLLKLAEIDFKIKEFERR